MAEKMVLEIDVVLIEQWKCKSSVGNQMYFHGFQIKLST